ncbi:MAG: GGDEF domain-containing protein [Gammaproteobacteria bacterium]
MEFVDAPDVRHFLGGLQLLNGVDIRAVGPFLARTRRIDLAAGETLLSPEKKNADVFVVLSGALNVYLESPDSPPLTVLHPGQCAGEMSIIEEKDPSAWVIAAQDSHLMVIEQDILWQMINVSHPFCRNLLVILSSRLRSDNEVILDSVGMLREFERHAVTDALTDLHNRHWLDDAFRRRVERCHRDASPASLVMVDVDQFKQFNDRFGHVAGDRALRLVAETLRSHFRPDDMIARFGGDEFSILLPGAELQDARGCAERARGAVMQAAAEDPGAPRITLSAGVARLERSDSLESLIARADDALYRAKVGGRNRVEI